MKGESETLEIYSELIDIGLDHYEAMSRIYRMFGEISMNDRETIEVDYEWKQLEKRIESRNNSTLNKT